MSDTENNDILEFSDNEIDDDTRKILFNKTKDINQDLDFIKINNNDKTQNNKNNKNNKHLILFKNDNNIRKFNPRSLPHDWDKQDTITNNFPTLKSQDDVVKPTFESQDNVIKPTFNKKIISKMWKNIL